MSRKDWCTVLEAAELTDRDERTIRRWMADPKNGIRTERPRRITYLNVTDLLRVEAAMNEAIAHPKRTPRSGGKRTRQQPASNRAN